MWRAVATMRRAITTIFQDRMHAILMRITPVVLLAKSAVRAKVHGSWLTPWPRVEAKHAIVLLPFSIIITKHYWIIKKRSCSHIRVILLPMLAAHLQVVEIADNDVLVQFLNDSLL